MKKVLYYFCLVFLLSVGVVQAAWHEVGKVTRVNSGHEAGPLYFTTEIQITTPGCLNVGYTVKEETQNSNRVYSLLLTAYVIQKDVVIFVREGCLAGRPEVDAVQMKDPGVSS